MGMRNTGRNIACRMSIQAVGGRGLGYGIWDMGLRDEMLLSGIGIRGRLAIGDWRFG